MSQYDTKFDLKINLSNCDLKFNNSKIFLYLEEYLMYEHHTYGLCASMTRGLTSK